MKTVAIEDLMSNTILSFCENAAELGCPRDKGVDMWFRELLDQERHDIMSHLIDIEERGNSMDDNNNIKSDNDIYKDEIEEDVKDVLLKEITLDIDEDVVEKVIKMARSKIVNDDKTLFNYGANLIIAEKLQNENIEENNEY